MVKFCLNLRNNHSHDLKEAMLTIGRRRDVHWSQGVWNTLTLILLNHRVSNLIHNFGKVSPVLIVLSIVLFFSILVEADFLHQMTFLTFH